MTIVLLPSTPAIMRTATDYTIGAYNDSIDSEASTSRQELLANADLATRYAVEVAQFLRTTTSDRVCQLVGVRSMSRCFQWNLL